MATVPVTDKPGLVASFFTLSGAGFGEPPRNSFIERCEAAAAAGFTRIGLHYADLPRTFAAGVDVTEMRAVLRNNGLDLVEIEFLGDWALGGGISRALAGIEAVADSLGGRQVSAGEFGADTSLDGISRRLRRPVLRRSQYTRFRNLPVAEAARRAADTASNALRAAGVTS